MGMTAAPAATISPPSVLAMTVTICTRHRTELLAHALASLRTQHRKPAEVLVIDNAPSDDATRRLLAERYPEYRYVSEPVLGLDFARNRALREARYDIVAFLDDDAVADEDWAGQMYLTLQDNPRAGLCTGRTSPRSQTTDAEQLFERNGGFGRGVQFIRLPQDAGRRLHGWPAPLIAWAVSVGNGANFAVRRTWALQIGGFDEAFELGEALHGGGDLDLFWRMLADGRELVYQPNAHVQHQHRTQMEAVSRQLADHQRALVAFLVKSRNQARGQARWWLNVFVLWRLVKPVLRMGRRCVGLDPLPMPMLWRMWRHAIEGLTIYPAAVRIAEQRRMECERGA